MNKMDWNFALTCSNYADESEPEQIDKHFCAFNCVVV